MEEKRLKSWEKLFKKPDEDRDALKRIQEIEVLLSELESLKSGSNIYRGSGDSVLFLADLSSTKADLKKEKNVLKKKCGISSDILSF